MGFGKDFEPTKHGRRSWTLEQRKLYRAWHNYYLTLAYTRKDPKTVWRSTMCQDGRYEPVRLLQPISPIW